MPARALEEGGFDAGIAAGGAVLGAAGVTSAGASVEISASWGLTDLLAARLGVGLQSYHLARLATQPARWQNGGTAFAGLRAAYDVLRIIPFAEFGLGVTLLDSAGPAQGVWLGPAALLGAEYLVDRRWSLAPALRVRLLPLRLSDGARAGAADSAVTADASVWVGRRF